MSKSTKTYQPLDDLIDKSGLKYKVVSERVGIPYNRFWRIRVKPSLLQIDEMEKIADVLNVDFMTVYKINKNFRKEVDKNTTQ